MENNIFITKKEHNVAKSVVLLIDFLLLIKCLAFSFTSNIVFFRLNIYMLYFFTVILIDLILIFCTLFLFKLNILGYLFFLTSMLILIFEKGNLVGSVLGILGILMMTEYGWFKKKKALRITIVILLYLFCILLQFLLSKKLFIYSLIENTICTIIGCAIIIFTCFYFRRYNVIFSEKKINLRDFKELNKRDAVWLQRIQNKDKYETIAIDEKMSIGSVKNRLKVIYTLLSVCGKTEFLNKYADYTFYYE